MFEFYNLCELKYASLNICCFSKNCIFVKQVRSLREDERLLDCVTSHLRPVVKSHGSESQNKHTMSTRMTDELCRCCFVSTFLFSVLKRPAPLSPRGVSNETTCFSDHLCTRLLTWNDQLRVSPRPRGAAEQIWRGKKREGKALRVIWRPSGGRAEKKQRRRQSDRERNTHRFWDAPRSVPSLFWIQTKSFNKTLHSAWNSAEECFF